MEGERIQNGAAEGRKQSVRIYLHVIKAYIRFTYEIKSMEALRDCHQSNNYFVRTSPPRVARGLS